MLVAPTLFLRPAPSCSPDSARPDDHSGVFPCAQATQTCLWFDLTISKHYKLAVKPWCQALDLLSQCKLVKSSNHQAIKRTPATPLPLPSLATSRPTSATPD